MDSFCFWYEFVSRRWTVSVFGMNLSVEDGQFLLVGMNLSVEDGLFLFVGMNLEFVRIRWTVSLCWYKFVGIRWTVPVWLVTLLLVDLLLHVSNYTNNISD